ncbi:uncharacterized protein LOC142634862 [Castanea sativa]|uniref:uncharacterized protein LOC142634862 n=1 Tax=Castanea sativa TaxID=21020 RepID=UPI003F64D448
MHRVLVDNGSSADILYYPAFQKIGIDKERLVPTNAPVVGFGGTRVYPLGVVTLSVTVGDYPQQITKDVSFLVVDCSSAYNAILERPTLNAWKAVTSTYYLMIKFPTEYGLGELRRNQRGIEVNSEKVKAIIELSPPRTVKEVQSLTGKIAALNRFVSRATDKCLPFFRTLKKSFEWTDECQKAFEELKTYLSALPLLSPSMPGEELFLYLAVSSRAISAALIKEEGKVQKPVYFISRALRGAEERYPPMEKLAFALVTAARKLKPYFQAHTINVLTDRPLRRAMSNPESAGRMALWAIELSEFDIQYQPRTAVKGQILANFVAEFTTTEEQGAEETLAWRIHTDGSSNKRAGGAGVVLHTSEGDKIECMIRLDFPTTNNEVEYEALVAGLELVIAAEAKKTVVYSDSQIVTSQAVSNEDCWMAPIMAYLKEGKLPNNKENARKLKVTAARFVLIKNVLYKREFSRPYLRCLDRTEADYVMKEIHEGVCGNDSGSRYGIPRVLVSDNGKQFDNDAFRDFCSQLGIKNHYSSPAHP